MIRDALAAARLTRLITRDAITARARVEVQVRAAEGQLPDWLVTFIYCPWCVGVWVALGVVVARRFRWWAPAARFLALAEVASLLVLLRPEPEPPGAHEVTV